MPPIETSSSYSSTFIPIPAMICLIPGVPFVFQFNSNHDQMHTIACLQTLESLKSYDNFDQILCSSIQLAKLSWGCTATDSTPAIKLVYKLDGMKTNDRSASCTNFIQDTFDGSYSLDNTVMKCKGLGTFLPAVQANSSEASAQIHQILTVLHTL